MLNCKDMTKLVSDSLEGKISVRQHMELWLHIMMCGMCRRFRSNIIELRKRICGTKGLLNQADICHRRRKLGSKRRSNGSSAE